MYESCDHSGLMTSLTMELNVTLMQSKAISAAVNDRLLLVQY